VEKLILKCGRFVSPPETDEQARLRALEVYLAHFTSEMEFLLAEMQRTLDRVATSEKEA
jgi:hypothetical protein